MERHITLPLTREEARTIKSGEQLLLSGVIYTARDAAHKRLCELVEKGEPLPFDVKNATIYYVGPTPAKPGQVIGSAGRQQATAWMHIRRRLSARAKRA